MKKHILTLLLTLVMMSAAAQQSFNFLNMVDADDGIKQIATEGMIIKFADGNLIATAGDKTLTIALAELHHMEFTNIQHADESYPKGDVDGNYTVEVADLNILINIILKKDTAEKYEGRAYVTGQNTVDIDDVNFVVNTILHKEDES